MSKPVVVSHPKEKEYRNETGVILGEDRTGDYLVVRFDRMAVSALFEPEELTYIR